MAILWNPEPVSIDNDSLVEKVEAMVYSGGQPFSDKAITLLGAISQAILAAEVGRQQPQFVALGYWLRPASMHRLRDAVMATALPSRLIVPRGVALHLPPTNVDTIFVYSWAASVLAGNCNIVRLPSNVDANTAWLVRLIAKVLAGSGQADCHIFAQWSQNDPIAERLSANCDLRMIWGGDTKVNEVSTTRIRPDGLSIGFPSRKSLAIINSAVYKEASKAERDALAQHFFNDVYWFDQMGCGSPGLLLWKGDPGGWAQDFLERTAATAARKGYRTETGTAISKLAMMNNLIASGHGTKGARITNALHYVEVTDLCAALGYEQGGGFLTMATIDHLSELSPFVGRSLQTLTHFGFDYEELRALGSTLSGRGGYRIVPIGQALQFDLLWDGVDLITHMTRAIQIKVR